MTSCVYCWKFASIYYLVKDSTGAGILFFLAALKGPFFRLVLYFRERERKRMKAEDAFFLIGFSFLYSKVNWIRNIFFYFEELKEKLARAALVSDCIQFVLLNSILLCTIKIKTTMYIAFRWNSLRKTSSQSWNREKKRRRWKHNFLRWGQRERERERDWEKYNKLR